MKKILLLTTICLTLCTALRAQEAYTKFSFSGYKVTIIPSDVFSIKMSDANIQFTKEIKDSILYISVVDQTGRIPKDELILYVKNIDYLYLQNCELVMNKPIAADSMKLYCGCSRGELKIVANSLLVNAGGGSHVKVNGKANFFNCEVGAGSSLDASDLYAEEGNVDAMGYSNAKINMKKILNIKKENASIVNVYKEK